MKKILIVVLTTIFSSIAAFAQTVKQSAKASYYHSKFNGRKTATGDIYRDYLLTAASNIYKLGTRLLITNKNTGKSVNVVVNDRMAPGIKGRVDLSKSAFQQIASLHHGIVPVEISVVNGKKEQDNSL